MRRANPTLVLLNQYPKQSVPLSRTARLAKQREMSASYSATNNHCRIRLCISVVLCATLLAVVLRPGLTMTHVEHALVSEYSSTNSNTFEENNSARDTTSVAFCITGKLRSLANEVHRRNFLTAFYNPIKSFEPDTFFNLDRTEQTENTAVLKILEDTFKPVDLSVVDIECNFSWCTNTRCISTGYSQFKRMAMCMEKIESHENSLNFKYDFVVRVRPDLLFQTSLPHAICWLNLRRDVVWDSDTLFFDDQKVQVRRASEVDFLIDTFKILPRELATDYMKGIAMTYNNCIPEVNHTENTAIGDEQVLMLFSGNKSIGGCGRKNIRWRWNECRALITLQIMDVHVGRLQDPSHETGRGSDLCRCVDPHDIWCENTVLQLTGKPFEEEVPLRTACFPEAGYTRASQLSV